VKGKIEIGRFIVPYRVYENDGPHLICLNGVQQSMAMWQSFIRHFSNSYRIVLFDFPDQGKGRILSGPIFISLDEQVEILREVIRAAGVRTNSTICTASWGGIVAVAFASKYQHAVKRLVLASMGTKANHNMMETIKNGIQVNMGDREKMAQMLIESFGQQLPERIRNKILTQFRTMSKENIRAFYEHGLFVLSTKKIGNLVNLEAIKAKTILINDPENSVELVKQAGLKFPIILKKEVCQ